jgi:hypothetical protein
VLGSPYRWEVVDETGDFTLDFLAAAQPLLERRIGIWMNSEWSWWYPGQTICVLVAAGLDSGEQVWIPSGTGSETSYAASSSKEAGIAFQRTEQLVAKLDAHMAQAQDDGDLSAFNRSYRRYRLRCTVAGQPCHDLCHSEVAAPAGARRGRRR